MSYVARWWRNQKTRRGKPSTFHVDHQPHGYGESSDRETTCASCFWFEEAEKSQRSTATALVGSCARHKTHAEGHCICRFWEP
jgi:hypothetical protein